MSFYVLLYFFKKTQIFSKTSEMHHFLFRANVFQGD